MSLFLIYFDVGKPVAPTPFPDGMRSAPLTITFKGRSGPLRQGTVLTYGGSSELFLAFGRGGFSIQGEMLRERFVAFLRQRLDDGAHPHFVFLVFRGRVESATIDVAHVARVPINEVRERLLAMSTVRALEASDVIEVCDEYAADGGDLARRPAGPR